MGAEGVAGHGDRRVAEDIPQSKKRSPSGLGSQAFVVGALETRTNTNPHHRCYS